MKRLIIAVLLLIATCAGAATFSSWNGVTIGRSAGNVAYWNGIKMGNMSTGRIAYLNGFRTYSTGNIASCGTSTGGTITTITGYRVHTFTTSGTFTPSGSCNVEYLVVGSGGPALRGGGAGGAVVTGSHAALTLAVTVGTVGATTGGTSTIWNSGAIWGYNAYGGGGGGGAFVGYDAAGDAAGGGGGGFHNAGISYAGGAGGAGGYAGGSAYAYGGTLALYSGGGGGGAAGAGGDGSSGVGGAPGAGVFSSISGTNTEYGMGGVGGVGSGVGDNGGVGVVIIRYAYP